MGKPRILYRRKFREAATGRLGSFLDICAATCQRLTIVLCDAVPEAGFLKTAAPYASFKRLPSPTVQVFTDSAIGLWASAQEEYLRWLNPGGMNE